MTATQPVIELKDVNKRFKLYHDSIGGPIKEALFFWRGRRYYAEKEAVKNASFVVHRGEVVGIIGANGAGKTTLLRMIAGLLPPDDGTLRVSGRISAILAMGIGINPDATGRDNIRIAGLLLGMPRGEVEAKMPGIVEFAEIGEYIDQPFRTYSSGMQGRLLFAISTSVDPDIFIVDEALAAGDVHFVRKCTRRIKAITKSGATVLFVSHAISLMQNLCTRILVMKNGEIVGDGEPVDMVHLYYRLVLEDEAKQAEMKQVASSLAEPSPDALPLVAMHRFERPLGMVSGTGEVQIGNLETLDEQRRPCTAFHSGGSVRLEFDFVTTLQPGTPVRLFVGIDRADSGEFVGEIHSAYFIDADSWKETQLDLALPAKGRIKLRLSPLLLLNDQFSFWIIVASHDKSIYYCEYRWVGQFFVSRREYPLFKGDGIFWHPVQIDLEVSEAPPVEVEQLED